MLTEEANSAIDRKIYMSVISVRCVIVVLIFVFYLLVKEAWILQGIKPLGDNPDTFCLFDVTHYWLDASNRVIIEYRILQYGLQFMSSVFIDFSFIYTLLVWILTSNTARLLYATMIFYGIRALIQVIVVVLMSREVSLSRSRSDLLGARLGAYLHLWCLTE